MAGVRLRFDLIIPAKEPPTRCGCPAFCQLLKHSIDNVAELTHAIEAVASGQTVLDISIAKKLAAQYALVELTAQERFALALLAEGYSAVNIMLTAQGYWDTPGEILGSLSKKLNLPNNDMKQRNIQAVLALVDPHSSLEIVRPRGYYQ